VNKNDINELVHKSEKINDFSFLAYCAMSKKLNKKPTSLMVLCKRNNTEIYFF